MNLTIFKGAYFNKKLDKWFPASYVDEDKTTELSWEQLVELFLTPHATCYANKHSVPCFIVGQSKQVGDEGVVTKEGKNWKTQQVEVRVSHSKDNLTSYDAIVVDVDGGMSIEQFKQQYADYEYVAYTSWSHKTAQKKHKDCFRVVLRVNEQMPADVYGRLQESLTETFPFADPAGFRAGQMFFIQSCSSENEHVAETWHNTGRCFDWTRLKLSEPIEYVAPVIPEGSVFGGKGRIRLDTIDMISFVQAHGMKPVKAGNGWYEVNCPWSYEHSDGDLRGAFVDAHTFHCKHGHGVSGDFGKRSKDLFAYFKQQTGSYEVFRPYCVCEPDPVPPQEQSDTNAKLVKKVQPALKAYNPKKRLEMLKKRFVPLKHTVNVMYAREGFGKSAIVREFVGNTPVIFACKCNELVEEKALLFKKGGLNVQTILGREYLLQRDWGVKAVMTKPTSPWDDVQVDEAATKQIIQTKIEKGTLESSYTAVINKVARRERLKAAVDEVWASTRAEFPKWDADIIVTTHSRAKVWAKMQGKQHLEFSEGGEVSEKKVKVRELALMLWDDEEDYKKPGVFDFPENTVVFYDDPSFDDFKVLFPVEQYKQFEGDKKLERRVFDKVRVYYVRPNSEVLGFNPQCHRVVFTTTELLTRMVIEKRFGDGVYCPNDLMPPEPIEGGSLTVFGTDLVRAKTDGLLPCIVERIRRAFPQTVYVADGQGVSLNHVNAKGRNDLIESSIIEVSFPHLTSSIEIADELEEQSGSWIKYQQLQVVDKAHQAIGRNTGYRRMDGQERQLECVVLIDTKLFQVFVDSSQYSITRKEMLSDRYFSPLDVKNAVEGKCEFVESVRTLVGGSDRYVKRHVKEVILDGIEAVKRAKNPPRLFKKIAFAVEDDKTIVDGISNGVSGVLDRLVNEGETKNPL